MGDAPTPEPAPAWDPRAEARRLLRTVRSGALATLTPEGAPYASLVTVATLPDGSPVLPLSTLAIHTRHVMADGRCSLLLDGAGAGDPLARPRLTLAARALRAGDGERAAWRARFLRRHPEADLYVDFGDFSFWRLEITGGRIVGGFGRVGDLRAADLLTDLAGAEGLIGGEARAVEHMNADHRDAVVLYATALCGGPAGDWRVVAFDPDGLDMGWRDLTLRLPFTERVADTAALRRELVRLVERARARAGSGGS